MERDECMGRMIQAINMSREKAEDMPEYVRKYLGISPILLYSRYDFDNVPENKREEMLEKIRAAEQRKREKAKEREERVAGYEAAIAHATSWDTDKVRREMQDARERLGVSPEEYFEKEYYRMTADEQRTCHEQLLREKKEQRRALEERQERERNDAIDAISKQTGESKRDVVKALTAALALLEITPGQYREYRVFDLAEEARQDWCAEIHRLEAQKNARYHRIRKALIGRAALHLGVSEAEAEETLDAIEETYKIAFKDAVSEKFYSLPEKEKKAAAENILKEQEKTARKNRKKHIRELKVDLNCTEQEAEERLAEAESRLGVSADIYTRYRFQDTPAEKLAQRYREVLVEEEERLERREEARESRIERLSIRAGWSHAQAEQAMIDAWNRSRISFLEYLHNDFHLLSAEQQDEMHHKLEQEKKEAQAQERKACIDAIMENRNCSAEDAEAILADAERRLKIKPQTYRRYLFFDIPEAEQLERYQEIQGQLSDRSQSQVDDYESYLPKIIEATGWTKKEALDRVHRAKENCGASWKDFYAFKFWNLDEEQQKEFFTSGYSKQLTKKYDELRSRDIFVNKEVFLEKFKDYLGRGWVVSNKVSKEEFAEAFKGTRKVMYKPSNNGNSGSGIEVFELSEGCEEAYKRISKLPRGIVEGYLVQHEAINRLYPYSVNTIRVATICHNGSVEIAYAIFRIGANKSCVDNFTTGGMVADMDLETGKARTDAVNVHGERFELHPDTQVAIKGFEIPYFKEGLEMVRRAGRNVNGYIGWDVAITENGPVLIEGNIDPGNRLLQMPHIPEKKGMAYVMRKYL